MKTNAAQVLPVERDWSDIETTTDDYVGWGVVSERVIVDLPGRGEVNVLAGWDCDYWLIVSAHVVETGEPVELSLREKDLIGEALTARRREGYAGD